MSETKASDKKSEKTKKRTDKGGGEGGNGADDLMGVAPDVALRLLREMLLFRRFEEKAEEAYAIGKIGGFCHLDIGQEAAAAGAIGALREDDYVVATYREHAQALAKGISPKAVMAELYGRVDGCSGGRGGSMHLFDAGRGFMGGNGIVGEQIPIATGIAFAIRYRREDRLAVCFMGEAAVNQGSFHESLNLAAVLQLPVIYAVENNTYGMGTAFNRVSSTDVGERSSAYGIPSHEVDGQNVLEVYSLFERLAGEVREGGGPRVVELCTYRFKGHSMSDPSSGTYRSREEVEKHTSEDDPIRTLEKRLVAAGHVDREAVDAMDAEVKAVVDEAAEFAEASPSPEPEALYQHVYATINEHGRLFVDGREDAPRSAAELES